MNYIGLDPGLSGAIAFIDHNGKCSVQDLPTFNIGGAGYSKRNIDAAGLRAIIRRVVSISDTAVAYLEAIHTMPGQGAASQASMMESFGAIKATLQICGIPYELVPPQRWKSHYKLPGKTHKAFAAQTRMVLKNLYPEIEATRCKRAKDMGRIEAMLIAHYGKAQL